jgi:hypothetical protein
LKSSFDYRFRHKQYQVFLLRVEALYEVSAYLTQQHPCLMRLKSYALSHSMHQVLPFLSSKDE